MIIRPHDERLRAAEDRMRSWAGAEGWRWYWLGHVHSGLTHRRHYRTTTDRAFSMFFVFGALLIVLFTLLTLPSGRMMHTPGEVIRLADSFPIEPAPKGKITVHAVTVHQRNLKWLEQFYWRSRPDIVQVRKIKRDDRMVKSNGKQYQKWTTDIAVYYGARAAGVNATYSADSIRIYDVVPKSPARRAGIQTGDRVRSINGTQVHTVIESQAAVLEATRQGKDKVLVITDGKPSGYTVRTNFAEIFRPNDTYGMVLFDEGARTTGLPFRYSSRSDFEGGSAGLATALAIYQSLGHGNDAPEFVATGSMRADGKIAPVGPNVILKARATERAGIKYFLVPDGDYQVANWSGSRLKLVPVSDVGDATRWLDRWSTNSKPKSP